MTELRGMKMVSLSLNIVGKYTKASAMNGPESVPSVLQYSIQRMGLCFNVWSYKQYTKI